MSHRARIRAVAALAAAALVGAGLVPTSLAPPVGAATTSLRSLRTIDHRLSAFHTPTGTPEYYSSPAVADLDGDSSPDVVVAGPDGTVTATRLSTGARLWQRPLGATAIQASPLVMDIDNNGKPDVVVATMDGRVVWLSGQNGSVVRTFRQGAPLHCPAGVDCRPDGFFATPVVADVNGDGRNEIVAASYDHSIYAWRLDGRLLWRTFLHDTLWSSPAVADIDRDGRMEVILGGDIYPNNPLGVPAGGLLWVLRGSSGQAFPGYPRSLPGQTIWSSPVITDLDGDGRIDAVVGTGTYGPFGDGPAARQLWAVTLSTRKNVPGWPVTAPGRVVHQPAVGDIDGDGRPEVVIGSEGGYVTAYEHTGVRKWRACNAVSTCTDGAPTHGGAVIADVDGDGVQEVISALGQHLRVFDGRNGTREAEFRLTDYGTLSPPSIAAVTEVDGRTVIVQSSLYRVDGHSGQARAGDLIRTNVLTTDQPLCAEDWPGFKGGPRRTGVKSSRAPWHPFPCARPFVVQQYRDLLGREPDQAGVEYWTFLLRTTWSGPRVAEGFLNSAEFGAVAAPVIRLWLGLDGGPAITATALRAQMDAWRSGQTLAELAAAMIDGTSWASQPAADFVNGVYGRLVGRAPTSPERTAALEAVDQDGRGAWLAGLSASSSVVARLRGPGQVAMAYVGLLGRGPDVGGWDYWVARVAGGVRPQRLVELFLASAEYRDRVQ